MKNLLQILVRHADDCSCYAYGRNVCDCGALRKQIRKGTKSGDDPIWSVWEWHTMAIAYAGRASKKK